MACFFKKTRKKNVLKANSTFLSYLNIAIKILKQAQNQDLTFWYTKLVQ